MREQRAAALCFALYSLLEACSVFNSVTTPLPSAAHSPWAFSLALTSGAVADFGADLFVFRRPRYTRVWLVVLGCGLAIQFLPPAVPDLLAWRQVGYVCFLLVLLCLPIGIFFRPLLREFGRLGLFALLPFSLFTLFAGAVLLRFLFVPGALESAFQTRVHGGLQNLLPVVLSSGLFHLTWLGLIVGRQVMRARRLARYDALTGVLQRATFEAEMDATVASARRNAQALTLAFLDLDHFKRINDLGGHRAGDEVLRRFAAVLRAVARSSDRVGRWGGEEFVLLMPDTDSTGAAQFLERLQVEVRARAIPVPAGCAPLSVSIGYGVLAEGETDWRALVARADGAMYQAKQAGRNRTLEAPAPARTHAAGTPDTGPG